jgi:sigma-B regulation protein RsbU (phosphoserine phosphatase)
VELEKIGILSQQIRQLAISLEHFVSLGVIPDKPSPVNLPEVIRKAIRQIDDEGRLDAIFNLGSLPVIEGYPVQLQELFFQLLHNAVSYRDVSKTLTIGVGATIIQQNIYQEFKVKHRYVSFARIVLTDDGRGFDASGDIFRILRNRDSKIRKLSFGLAFCKQITDNHFGSIDVLSEPGKGTTVTILLPLVQETEKINEHF